MKHKHNTQTCKLCQSMYNAGKEKLSLEIEKVIDDLNERFRKENTYVRLDGDEFNDLWAGSIKKKLLGGEDDTQKDNRA